jgi:uncharacterized protein YbjQ (UPF0145 family)
MILTTGSAVEGQPVREYLDVVASQAISGIHVGRDLRALGRSIVGGRSGIYEQEFARPSARPSRNCGPRLRRSVPTRRRDQC